MAERGVQRRRGSARQTLPHPPPPPPQLLLLLLMLLLPLLLLLLLLHLYHTHSIGLKTEKQNLSKYFSR